MTQLERIARLYGTTADGLEKLGAFESDVYAYEGPQGPAILKVIGPDHRKPDQVQAEVDWLLSLHEADVPVGVPLKSGNGQYVETVEEPGQVLVAFRRVPGERVGPDGWTEDRIHNWGALLGRLQSHSRNYAPPGPKRKELIESGYLHRLDELVTDDDRFKARTAALLEQGRPHLGEGSDSGLVHADLHYGNLLLDNETWSAIDFDDSGYASYMFDLAIPLYYAIRALKDLTSVEAMQRFLPPYLRGFRQHAPEPEGGAEAIAMLLQLRQAELVLAIRAMARLKELPEHLHQMERQLRARVAQGQPMVDAATIKRLLN